MVHNTLAVILVTLAIQLIAGQDINSVVAIGGRAYAFDGFPFLSGTPGFVARAYEITNGVKTRTIVLAAPYGTLPLSAFVNGNTLYQFNGAYGVANLVKYSLPFASNNPVPVNQLALDSHLMIPAIIDTTDMIALAVVTRNLNLINLRKFNVTSTFKAIIGSGKNAGALVYNRVTNRAYFFITNYCSNGFCQHIQEYSTVGGVLVQLPESFTPNYNTQFNTGGLTGCALDYPNNKIWCLNAETDKLVRLNINNLNTNMFIALPSTDYTDGNVAFDFLNNKAYVVANSPGGFRVMVVNLPSGVILQDGTYVGNPVVSVSLVFASGKLQLYLGHDNADSNIEMTIVDTITMVATYLTL